MLQAYLELARSLSYLEIDIYWIFELILSQVIGCRRIKIIAQIESCTNSKYEINLLLVFLERHPIEGEAPVHLIRFCEQLLHETTRMEDEELVDLSLNVASSPSRSKDLIIVGQTFIIECLFPRGTPILLRFRSYEVGPLAAAYFRKHIQYFWCE